MVNHIGSLREESKPMVHGYRLKLAVTRFLRWTPRMETSAGPAHFTLLPLGMAFKQGTDAEDYLFQASTTCSVVLYRIKQINFPNHSAFSKRGRIHSHQCPLLGRLRAA